MAFGVHHCAKRDKASVVSGVTTSVGFVRLKVGGETFELKCDSLTEVFVQHFVEDLVFLGVEATGVLFEFNSFTIFEGINGKPFVG